MAEKVMERSAQEAVPRLTAPMINNFQVRFVLDKIFNVYKDRQYIKNKSIIELGTKFLDNKVSNIEPSEWELLKKKTKIEIFSKLLNNSSSVHHTFKTRDLCMKWVYGMSHPDYRDFLTKEIEFVLTRLCDTKSSYRVSEKWCQDNNFKTEDNPDVLETICKAMGVTDKNSLVTDLKHELQQRTEDYWKFQEDWIAAMLKDPEAITWNPLLFDLCATKFNIAVSVIANMTLPGRNEYLPVICECRIYPKRDKPADISHVTFIRMKYEKYVHAIAEVAPVGLCRLLHGPDKTLESKEKKQKEDRVETGCMSREVNEYQKDMETNLRKFVSENEDLHESLQKLQMEYNNLLEEKKDLLYQLKSKSQKQVDEFAVLQENLESLTQENERMRNTEIAALKNEIEALKCDNKRLITQNINLKSKLKHYGKESGEQKKILIEQNTRIALQDKKLIEQDIKIAQQNHEITNQSKEINERISILERNISRNSGSISTRHIDVESASSISSVGSVKSVYHK